MSLFLKYVMDITEDPGKVEVAQTCCSLPEGKCLEPLLGARLGREEGDPQK